MRQLSPRGSPVLVDRPGAMIRRSQKELAATTPGGGLRAPFYYWGFRPFCSDPVPDSVGLATHREVFMILRFSKGI